ncbi:MAG: DUF883 family protein [Steroidobacteraceae bacterium]
MNDIHDSNAFIARREIRDLIFNLEALLEEVGEEGGITVAELRQSLLNTIADVKEQSRVSLVDTVRNQASQVRNAAVLVNDFVHDHPWTAVMIGTGIGRLVRALPGGHRKS